MFCNTLAHKVHLTRWVGAVELRKLICDQLKDVRFPFQAESSFSSKPKGSWPGTGIDSIVLIKDVGNHFEILDGVVSFSVIGGRTIAAGARR